MNPELYALIESLYAKSPPLGARCTDAAWSAFQAAVHAFWGSVLDTEPSETDRLIAAAVEVQAREYLRATREIPA